MAQYPAGWTAEAEREFQATLRPKTPEGWSPEAEAAYQDQFGADAIDYANQGVRSLGRGTLNAVADVTGLGGQALRQMGVDPSFLPAENVSQGFRSAAGAIPDVPIVQDAPSGVAKFVSTTGADALGQALPGMATMGAGAAAGLGTRAVGFLGAGLGAAQGATQGGREAAEYGASNAEQWGAFLLNGGLSMADAIVPSKILARLDEATGGGIKKAALSIVADGVEGGGIEMLQQAGLDAYAKGTFDPERDILGSVGEAGAGGGFASTVLSVLGQVAGVAKARGIKKGEAAPPPDADTATFTEEPVEATTTDLSKPGSVSSSEPFGNSEGLDLTGQSGAVAEQTTGAAPLPVTSPSGDAGAAATQARPEPRTLSARIEAEHPGSVLDLHDNGSGVWELSRVVVPKAERKQGVGTAIMEKVIAAADEAGARVVLSPSTDFGGTSVARLRRFYSRFGFQNNTGRRADPSISASMIREPKPVERVSVADELAQPQAVEPAPDAGSRREQTPAALETPPVSRTSESARLVEGAVEPGALPPAPVTGRDPTIESVPHYGPDREATGVKNRTVDAELKSLGIDNAEHDSPLRDTDVHKRATETFNEDNLAGKRIADELADSDRTATADEIALLTFEAARLKGEHRKASEKFRAEPTAENRAALDKAAADYGTFGDTVTKLGTRQAQAFRLRRMMLRADYSAAEMEARAVEANGGVPLTDDERTTIADQSKRIAELEAKLAEADTAKEREQRLTALEETVAQMARGRQRAVRSRDRDTRRAEVRARRDTNLSRLAKLAAAGRSNIPDVETIKVAGEVALDNLRLGLYRFADFADVVVQHYGEKIRPHLQKVWNDQVKAFHGEMSEPLAKRLKEGRTLTELRSYVDKIALSFVNDGVTDREQLVTAVHDVLKTADAKITRDQTADAISGYGDFRPLSQDQAKRRLRELKGELQQLGKLRDLEKKLPPKKSGPERQAPTDETRRLIAKVNEMRTRLGLKVTDPETQLKSTLDALKKRLDNQIADLTTEIETGSRIRRDRTPVQLDAEATAKKATRDQLKAQRDAIFEEPKKAAHEKEAARIADEIAELDRKIKAGDVAVRRKQGPDTAAVTALKERRAALNEQVAAMREAAKPKKDEQAAAIERATKAVAKQIEDLELRIATGDTAARKGQPGPSTPELDALKATRDALRAELTELRDANDPEVTPEERAQRAAETRTANEIARLRERISYGDFEPRTRKDPAPPTEKQLDQLAELQRVKTEFARGQEMRRRRLRTRTQVILEGAKQALDLPRAVWSSGDVSAVFRQGGVLSAGELVTRPDQFARRIARMFRALASTRYAERVESEITNHPAYREAKKNGLELTGIADPFTVQEEAIKSTLAEKIPGISQVVKASNRAFTVWLNLQRFDAYRRMVAATDGNVRDGKAIANFVNVATGRGAVGKGKFAKAVDGAGTVMWAPRLYVSRFQLLAGQPLMHGSVRQRARFAAEYAKSLAGLAAFYGLVHLYAAWNDDDDVEVSTDPLSSDGGKVRINNTRIDPLAGLQQPMRLAARLQQSLTGESKEKASELIWTFLKTKASPSISVPYELATGESLPFPFVKRDRADTARDLVVPLSFQDVGAIMEDQGVPKAIVIEMLSLLGMSVYVKEEKAKK